VTAPADQNADVVEAYLDELADRLRLRGGHLRLWLDVVGMPLSRS